MATIREKILFNLGLVQVISICEAVNDTKTGAQLNTVLEKIDLASPDISIVPPESMKQYQEIQKELLTTFSFLFHGPDCSCEKSDPAESSLSRREKASVRLGIALGGTLCEKFGAILVLLPLMVIENQIDQTMPEIALGDEANEEFYTLLNNELSTELLDPVLQMRKDKLN